MSMKNAHEKKIKKESSEDGYQKLILELVEGLSRRLEKIPLKHDKVNESIRGIRSQSQRLFNGLKTSQAGRGKMVALYQSALTQCESEQDNLEKLLSDIQRRRQLYFRHKIADKLSRGSLLVLIAQYAHSLPLYIGKVDGHPPPGVGAIQKDATFSKNDLIAAYVDDMWILAEITNQVSEYKYEIRDVDDETERPIILNQNRLIPLPEYRADPKRHGHALFVKNTMVLALYPQTTCFYKGVVESPPGTATEDYMIFFEDNTFQSGYSPTLPVPQMYCLSFREGPINRKRRVIVSDDEDD